jgi:hypothetical protein
MSAEIIRLADVRARRNGYRQAYDEFDDADLSLGEPTARFHFWTGASGKRYVHTVYSIFDCPSLEAANYVLVHREGKATRTILAIGRLAHDAPALNLAEIRQRAAVLGADEVHLHLLASSAQEAYAVEVDLLSAQGGPQAS